MNLGGWEHRYCDDVLHVVPTDDLREHEPSDCWCSPVENTENYVNFIVHNSMDKREEYENGGKLS